MTGRLPPRGKVVYIKWITRNMLRQNPEARFVFGDNVQRLGFGGQAKEMRGEPNAIGIVTKWRPDMEYDAFFDTDSEKAWEKMEADLKLVLHAINDGRTIYVPYDGLGTGLSKLPQKAPALYTRLWAFFATNLPGEPCPWPWPGELQSKYA